MAQSNNVSVDTLANLFTDMQNKIVMQAGPNNTDETVGKLYNIFVPREALPNLAAYRQFVSNNWNGTRHGFKSLDTAAKIAKAAAYPGGFEPSEPRAQSPLELAVQNIIVRRNPDKFAGMTASQISDALEKPVATVLNDPARTEQYRELIEKELAAIAAWSQDRQRKGDGTTKTDELEKQLDF